MPSPNLLRPLLFGTLAFALSFGVTTGCSKKAEDGPIPPDAATEEIAPDAGDPNAGDGGSADAGKPPCATDLDCDEGLRCDDSSRACVAALPCQDESNCGETDSYCDTSAGSLGCRCIQAKTTTPPSPNTGWCKRRLPACTECKTDEECGNDPAIFQTSLHNEAYCVPMMDGKKYCLEKYNSTVKCACGTALVINGKSYCAPQSQSCANGAFLCCQSDSECPPDHPLCDTNTQLCRDVCTYSFENSQTVGCRADQVCNVDPQFLTSKSVNYGAGRCAPPCMGDAECQAIRPDFICKAEIKPDGGKGSEPRCRPAGCVSDYECPDTAVGSPYRGYCDRGDGKCKTNSCRTGKDPITAVPYADCKAGYKCDGASLTCVEQNCVEQGGSDLACAFDELCCGEDRDGNGQPDPCVNDANISLAPFGKCYKAPAPPWCKPCQMDTDCPKGGTAGISYSAKDPSKCMDLGNGSQCFYGCTLRTQCPRGYSCQELYVDCSMDPMTCGDATRCKDTGQKDQMGNPIKRCSCTTAGAAGGECPMGTRCNNSGKYCIYTQACLPGAQNCQ